MFQFSQDTDDHFKLREIVSKAFFFLPIVNCKIDCVPPRSAFSIIKY